MTIEKTILLGVCLGTHRNHYDNIQGGGEQFCDFKPNERFEAMIPPVRVTYRNITFWFSATQNKAKVFIYNDNGRGWRDDEVARPLKIVTWKLSELLKQMESA